MQSLLIKTNYLRMGLFTGLGAGGITNYHKRIGQKLILAILINMEWSR